MPCGSHAAGGGAVSDLGDRACDWCGDFEDICGPLEEVLYGDAAPILLCEDCLEWRCHEYD
jgi:hypothetical protein